MLLAAAHGSCAPSHLRVPIIAAGGVTLVMSIASASLRAATKSRVRVVLLSYARIHDCGAKSISCSLPKKMTRTGHLVHVWFFTNWFSRHTVPAKRLTCQSWCRTDDQDRSQPM